MSAETASIGPVEIRANRYDLVSRLADDLAHEIKNPLHSMVINLELVRRRAATGGDGVQERISVVESEIGRVNLLIDSLLQLLRPGRDPALSVDARSALDEVLPILHSVAKAGRMDLTYEPPPMGHVLPIRRLDLKHALLNLFVNGVEAAGAGGAVQVGSEVDAGEVRLWIRDGGPGVPPELEERIGTAGATSRPGRAGLGVAVARHLVEGAGGRLERRSNGGRGAAFALVFPSAGAA